VAVLQGADGPLGAERAATILVCITCRRPGDPEQSVPRAGAELARATAVAAAGHVTLRVRGVRCLANCQRGLSAAIIRQGAWSYIFGDLNRDDGPAALVAGARLLAAAADGLMPWVGRPLCLKRGMIARVPPPENTE
jgi:predicted metal-binding protein